MIDPLDILWTSFDTDMPLYCDDLVCTWQHGAFDWLRASELILPAENASHIACPFCPDRHVEEVIFRRTAAGTREFFIPCPESIQVSIPPDRLRQWRPNYQRLAREVKELLKISGRVTERVDGRLWRLGATTWAGRPRQIFLARGLAWSDGATVARQIPTDDRPIVFVGMITVPTTVWANISPAVVLLSTVLSAEGGHMTVDAPLLAQLINGADETAACFAKLAKSDLQKRVRLAIDKQLDEGGTNQLVGALASQGLSVRDTAREMKKRGVPIHPATVARRRKDIVQAGPPPSSPSIVRHAVSQPRDGRGGTIADAQPEEE